MSNFSDDMDAIFSGEEITDAMLDADREARREMGDDFPGWMLYRKVIAGVTIFDDDLSEWAYMTAHALASAVQENGRRYVWQSVAARPGWVTQAGWDALDRAIDGAFPASLDKRAQQYGVSPQTYRKVRDPLAGGIIIGMETYRGILHYHYLRTKRLERLGLAD